MKRRLFNEFDPRLAKTAIVSLYWRLHSSGTWPCGVW